MKKKASKRKFEVFVPSGRGRGVGDLIGGRLGYVNAGVLDPQSLFRSNMLFLSTLEIFELICLFSSITFSMRHFFTINCYVGNDQFILLSHLTWIIMIRSSVILPTFIRWTFKMFDRQLPALYVLFTFQTSASLPFTSRSVQFHNCKEDIYTQIHTYDQLLRNNLFIFFYLTWLATWIIFVWRPWGGK